MEPQLQLEPPHLQKESGIGIDAYPSNSFDSFIESPLLRNVLDDYNLEISTQRGVELHEPSCLLLRVHSGLDLEPGIQERIEDVSRDEPSSTYRESRGNQHSALVIPLRKGV